MQKLKVIEAYEREHKKIIICDVPKRSIERKHILYNGDFKCKILAFRIAPDRAVIRVKCDEFKPEILIGKTLNHKTAEPAKLNRKTHKVKTAPKKEPRSKTARFQI